MGCWGGEYEMHGVEWMLHKSQWKMYLGLALNLNLALCVCLVDGRNGFCMYE